MISRLRRHADLLGGYACEARHTITVHCEFASLLMSFRSPSRPAPAAPRAIFRVVRSRVPWFRPQLALAPQCATRGSFASPVWDEFDTTAVSFRCPAWRPRNQPMQTIRQDPTALTVGGMDNGTRLHGRLEIVAALLLALAAVTTETSRRWWRPPWSSSPSLPSSWQHSRRSCNGRPRLSVGRAGAAVVQGVGRIAGGMPAAPHFVRRQLPGSR